MNSRKFFFVMLVIFSISLLGGGGMLYMANHILQSRSNSIVGLKLDNAKYEAQLTAYQSAKKDVIKYSYLNDIISSALPQDKDQARSVREIFLMAEKAGITLRSVTFNTSTLGAKASATSSSTSSSSSSSATSATANSTITQAKPVKGLTGVYSIETTVTPYADDQNYKVTYAQLIKFLQSIESNRRAMQVASIQLNPLGQSSSDSISFVLTLNIFIKP